MKKVIPVIKYADEPLTKEQTCAKFDLTEEQREARLSLGPIQEIWTIKSHEKAEVMKAFNTFSDVGFVISLRRRWVIPQVKHKYPVSRADAPTVGMRSLRDEH